DAATDNPTSPRGAAPPEGAASPGGVALPGGATLPGGPVSPGGTVLSGPDAVRRILISSTWFGAVVILAAWVYFGWPWALGFAGGVLVGGGNLFFLAALIREIITTQKRNFQRIALLLAIKVMVVYGGLAVLLIWKVPPVLSVVAGFSLVLVVITLRAVGRELLAGGFFRIPTRKGKDGESAT
ncbi:MAG: hypothetical protein KAY24_12125, partial [Candidatus Eisenbacteria sp.]|nr:hypothetical protein [Candidatus Eisenbacteria bacterium]